MMNDSQSQVEPGAERRGTAETGDTVETAQPAGGAETVLEPAAQAGAQAVEGTKEGGAGEVEAEIVEMLRTVFDPEIPVDIYELGLIYDLNVEPDGKVQIKMTLTSPACPVAGSLPIEVKTKVEQVPGVESADVEVVWDPVWNPSMMSEAARLQLGMF